MSKYCKFVYTYKSRGWVKYLVSKVKRSDTFTFIYYDFWNQSYNASHRFIILKQFSSADPSPLITQRMHKLDELVNILSVLSEEHYDILSVFVPVYLSIILCLHCSSYFPFGD